MKVYTEDYSERVGWLDYTVVLALIKLSASPNLLNIYSDGNVQIGYICFDLSLIVLNVYVSVHWDNQNNKLHFHSVF